MDERKRNASSGSLSFQLIFVCLLFPSSSLSRLIFVWRARQLFSMRSNLEKGIQMSDTMKSQVTVACLQIKKKSWSHPLKCEEIWPSLSLKSVEILNIFLVSYTREISKHVHCVMVIRVSCIKKHRLHYPAKMTWWKF